MKRAIYLLAAMFVAGPALAVKTGDTAPAFELKSSDGKTVKLGDYKGKTVVLEWLNHGCPFVKKHYQSKNMQKLQADAKKDGAIWLSIVSSAPGKQGHGSAVETEKMRKEHGSNATAVLMDEDGKVGKAYDAKVTPHMFVINKEGVVVYQGAIDDKPSTDLEDVETAKPYVRDVLSELRKPGGKIAINSTQPYGCSVKY